MKNLLPSPVFLRYSATIPQPVYLTLKMLDGKCLRIPFFGSEAAVYKFGDLGGSRFVWARSFYSLPNALIAESWLELCRNLSFFPNIGPDRGAWVEGWVDDYLAIFDVVDLAHYHAIVLVGIGKVRSSGD